MRSKMFYLVVFSAFGLFAKGLCAADIDLDRIVVTPGRIQENIKGTISSVSVFTKNEIEKSKANNITDFLKETVGLDLTQIGSFGGPVSIFLRGANSNHTQVMIDNVRVYDPISTSGAFNLAHLTLDNLERIEIVRGPQSLLYGSDAIAGVINIITKKGKGKPSLTFLSEAGPYQTIKGGLGSQGEIGNLSYSLGLSQLDSRGISKLKNTSENDPYKNTSLSLKANYDLNESHNAGLIGRLTEASYEYDNSVGLKDDPDLVGKEQQLLLSNYLESRLTDIWQQKLQFSFMRDYRQDFNNKDASYPDDYLRDWFTGENLQAEFQHTLKLSEYDNIICGLSWQREEGNYYYYTEYLGGSSEIHFPKSHSSTKSCYLQNMLNLNDAFRFNTGMRIDDHSYAGVKKTYKMETSYLFKTKTKIKGSFGTAFKAPTLYQLHALADPWFGGGNSNLSPEESQSYETGLEQSAFGDKLQFGLAYYHTQLKNLIDAKYNPATWVTEAYSNINKARVFGYESSLSLTPVKEIKLGFGWTWEDTEDKSNGDELLRRPKNKYFSSLNFIPAEKLNLGLKLLRVGHRNDSANRLLKAYTKIDLNANYKINPACELFAKIDNLSDEDYEETKNYAVCGRSFYTGVELKF
jgi:vitamin B12 transporter